jgi:DNA-binding NarL/FixJ family response regulator
LLKSSATSELFTAIEHARRQDHHTPHHARCAARGFSGRCKPGAELTARQREVLQLLAEARHEEIADLVHVTARTVAFHKYTIMEQLGLKTNTDLVQYAVEHGLRKARVGRARHLLLLTSIATLRRCKSTTMDASTARNRCCETPARAAGRRSSNQCSRWRPSARGQVYVVGAVADGAALLIAAARLDPAVIVLDITMPQLDGLKAARELRRTHPRARLVFLTVHDDADFARAALAAGALGYVVKARLASDLLTAVRAALANHRFISPTVSLDDAA